MLHLISPAYHTCITLGTIVIYCLIFYLFIIRSALKITNLEHDDTIPYFKRDRLISRYYLIISRTMPLLYLLSVILFIAFLLFVNAVSAFIVVIICVGILNLPRMI